MGNDGGSVPKGSDLRKTKKAEKKGDPVEMNRVRWLTCALSKVPLQSPIVTDQVGYLMNKDALLKALINKSLPAHMDHIRSLKDVFEVHFHLNNTYTLTARADKVGDTFVSPFDCPITGRQVNGQYAFIALKKCGHVFSEKGLRETEKLGADGRFHCFTCTTAYGKEDLHVLNPSPDLAEDLRDRIKAEQKNAKESRKRTHEALKEGKEGVSDGKEKEKEKEGEREGEGEEAPEPKLKKHKADKPRHASSSSASKLAAPSLAVKVALMKADSAVDQRKVSEAYTSIFSSNSDSAHKTSDMNFTGIFFK